MHCVVGGFPLDFHTCPIIFCLRLYSDRIVLVEEGSQRQEVVAHPLGIRLEEEEGIGNLEEARQEEETGDHLVEEMEDLLEDLVLQGKVALVFLVRRVEVSFLAYQAYQMVVVGRLQGNQMVVASLKARLGSCRA